MRERSRSLLIPPRAVVPRSRYRTRWAGTNADPVAITPSSMILLSRRCLAIATTVAEAPRNASANQPFRLAGNPQTGRGREPDGTDIPDGRSRRLREPPADDSFDSQPIQSAVRQRDQAA